MNDVDAIVIGSGIGGLTAAAILGRLRGWKVLVLERHIRPGGFTHTFHRKGGWTWDVGVHYVGPLHEGLERDVFTLLTDDHLRWARMPEVYDRVVFPDFEFGFRAGAAATRSDLVAAFPREAAGIDAWLAAVDRSSGYLAPMAIRSLLPGFAAPIVDLFTGGTRRLSLRRTGDWLGQHIQDPRLRAVLGARWLDYGLPPAQSAMLMHAIISRHYLEGAYYPEGSSASIAACAKKVIEDAGGEVRTNTEVAEVVLEGGRAVGVRLAKGEQVRAPVVISNAGARNTYLRLLPESAPVPFREQLRGVAPGMGSVSAFLGLRGSPAGLGTAGENLWLHDELDQDRLAARSGELLDGRAPVSFVSFPSLKDPLATHHTVEIAAPADAAPFQKWAAGRWYRRGEDYTALKAKLGEALLDAAERRLPGLRDLVEVREIGTPLSTIHFTAHPGGESYGTPATPERFQAPWVGPRTPIPGLYLAGADALVLGVVGAAMGGAFATAAVLGLSTIPAISREASRRRASRPAIPSATRPSTA